MKRKILQRLMEYCVNALILPKTKRIGMIGGDENPAWFDLPDKAKYRVSIEVGHNMAFVHEIRLRFERINERRK